MARSSSELPEDLRGYLLVKDMAAELKVHISTVRRLITTKKIPGVFTFAGKYMISRKDFDAFKESNKTG